MQHQYALYDRPVRDVHSGSKALELLGGRLPAARQRDALGAAAERAARRPTGRGANDGRGDMAPRAHLQDRITDAMRAF